MIITTKYNGTCSSCNCAIPAGSRANYQKLLGIYCPTCPTPKRNGKRSSLTMYLVSVYLEDLAYGGPEEGGWYYGTGELVRTVKVFGSGERANDYCRRLNRKLRSREFGPNKDRRDISSVLSEGIYVANVYENTAPQFFPDRKPHYE